MSEVLMVGTPVTSELATALGGRHVRITWESLDTATADLSTAHFSRAVVAIWHERVDASTDLVDVDDDAWRRRFEQPFAMWAKVLGVVAAHCSPGGHVIAVVERPAPLDCAGRAPESAVSDAIEAMVRSLARSEGPRNVRVNAVVTPSRITQRPVVDPQPPLRSFPGSSADLVQTVRVLLEGEAPALTAEVIHADYGRSWR